MIHIAALAPSTVLHFLRHIKTTLHCARCVCRAYVQCRPISSLTVAGFTADGAGVADVRSAPCTFSGLAGAKPAKPVETSLGVDGLGVAATLLEPVFVFPAGAGVVLWFAAGAGAVVVVPVAGFAVVVCGAGVVAGVEGLAVVACGAGVVVEADGVAVVACGAGVVAEVDGLAVVACGAGAGAGTVEAVVEVG